MRFYIISAIVILLMACSKTEYETVTGYGGLSFYNASYTLDTYLPVSSNGGFTIQLPLAPLEKLPVPLAGMGTPSFSQLNGSRQDFPAVNWYNEIPWMVFDQYTPADYTASVHLGSVDSISLFTFPVTVTRNERHSYFLADSLGSFSVTTLNHEQGVAANEVKLCLVQLCPDADSVNVRVGNLLLTGIRNMPYRSVSAYNEYPLSADSTLKLRLFNAGDTLHVIARTDLMAQPGHSYILVFRNYSKEHQYPDKDGKEIHIIPNGILDVRKTE